MPELPEVETVKRGLEKLLIGKIFKSVDFDWPKSFPNASADVNQFLIGAEITAVRRRAKVLMIDLSTQYSLVIHLKMTGQMVYRGSDSFAAGHPNDSMVSKLPDRSTRVEFIFDDKTKLFFNDQRKFGWVKLIPTDEIKNMPFFQKVGPEPLVDTFTTKEFKERFRKRNKTGMKAAILDQSVIAGVGNIYADEALFAAKIHPETRVYLVPDSQLDHLYHELRAILQLSIDSGGSTDKNYVDAEGNKGSYLTFAKVFRREGLPCHDCSNDITKTRVAGRGTHICTVCQVKVTE